MKCPFCHETENRVIDSRLSKDSNMATYELVFCPDIPSRVSLDEAIEIGKRFGSAESATFINGVLDHVAQASGVKSD